MHSFAHNLIERPVLQGIGFVLLRDNQQVAIGHQCIGGKAWSIRVAGVKFPMNMGQRFLAHRNKRYSDLTYVGSAVEARDLAYAHLSRQRKAHVIDAIYRTGTRSES